MRTKTLAIAAAVAAVLTIGPSPATAAAGDGALGGPPDPTGVPDETLCPPGSAVTGVEGVTRIIGGFIPVVAVATVQCSDGAPAFGTMGAGEGVPGSTSCPEGQVAIGITGREGDFVDFLALRCAAPDGSGPITTTAGFGGAFGTPDGPYDCAPGTVIISLRGQTVFNGETVRYIQPVCAQAGPPDEDGDGIPDTPPPTDKAQCKDGGFAAFNNPSFRNQGQCVSYVTASR